ncbi:hypothetical protein GCM10007962_28100 [Yeosuana aromativorans]|uniref:Uncharacterized protein n=1 Tax=Yeosuana aromativorans TaxID=288019 RepID=A0A8J3BM15_9FLAO|nr:DUF6090 family protein [Yeosuana aromativorans]GGK32136.1 hypothetical protein GCM10007962_28100 [Yeosuana aromativorans]
MLRFFKTIRLNLLTNNNIRKYLFYAIGEIILVVIGILIALKINNWNSDQIEKQQEIKTYSDVKEQIQQNLEEISKLESLNDYYKSLYNRGNIIISNKKWESIDTLAFIAMNLSQYSDFHGNDNLYESLVNSGDIKRIKNPDIQKKLQNLESTYRYINKLEDIQWEIIIKELSPELRGVINYSNFHIEKPKKLFSVELQNIIIESIYVTAGKDSIYNRALKEIDIIDKLINMELEDYNK